MHILKPETDNCPSWISRRERMTIENISWSISMKECCKIRQGLYPQSPDHQSNMHPSHWHLSLRPWIYRLNTPSVYQWTSKCKKTSEKKKKNVFDDSSRFSKYKYEHGLKCKLGHLVLMDFSNFKQFIFPSTCLSFSSRVLTLSRDIGHDFEITVFTGENLTFTFITNAHYSIF